MSEVFDCFFAEDEKSDYQVAELIFRVVKAIREGDDAFYEDVLTKCIEARKKLGSNFDVKGEVDSDDEGNWSEEEVDETPLVKADIEQFKKKKKKEKVTVDMDEDMLDKMKHKVNEDDDEEWNPA